VITYLSSPSATRELIAELTHDAAAAGPPFTEQTVVAVNGVWWPRGWQQDLRDSAVAGRPVTSIGVRTATTERELTSRDWSGIARRLAHRCRWQSAPWVAVRTSAWSMVLLASSADRPSPQTLHQAAKVIAPLYGLTAPSSAAGATDQISQTQAPSAQDLDRRTPEPFRIIDARHDERGSLHVLVARVPDLAELRFTPYTVANDDQLRRHPGPDTLYVAVHPGGYVWFVLDTGDGQGFNGEPFDLTLVDGTRRTVVGPWSSRPAVAAEVAPDLDVYLGEAIVHDDAHRFRNGSGDGRMGCLTRPGAQRALEIAAAHPAEPARAFPPLRTPSPRARLPGRHLRTPAQITPPHHAGGVTDPPVGCTATIPSGQWHQPVWRTAAPHQSPRLLLLAHSDPEVLP
jgi:hypothetical protein